MLRLVVGLIKGAVLGGALGVGARELGLGGGWSWLVAGFVGLVVGFLVGRPFWSHLADGKSTIWTSILKGVFGFGVGVGLWSVVAKALGDPALPAIAGVVPEGATLAAFHPALGAIVGLVYGAWVEVDDPPVKRAKSAAAAAETKPPAKR